MSKSRLLFRAPWAKPRVVEEAPIRGRALCHRRSRSFLHNSAEKLTFKGVQTLNRYCLQQALSNSHTCNVPHVVDRGRRLFNDGRGVYALYVYRCRQTKERVRKHTELHARHNRLRDANTHFRNNIQEKDVAAL